MDRASAVRAMGRANGTLTGYAGGIERKRWLLRHEGGDF
ncbi:MGMT family protein [Acidithiobacillus ferrivorans]|nr:MGMT family protein [Acidithiobacillus ferrivorans]